MNYTDMTERERARRLRRPVVRRGLAIPMPHEPRGVLGERAMNATYTIYIGGIE